MSVRFYPDIVLDPNSAIRREFIDRIALQYAGVLLLEIIEQALNEVNARLNCHDHVRFKCPRQSQPRVTIRWRATVARMIRTVAADVMNLQAN